MLAINLRNAAMTSAGVRSAAALGLIAGAVLGAAAGLGLLFVLGGTDRVLRGWGLGVLCAAYGAVLGLVLAPLTKLLLLPDVSLRRGAWSTFAGALLGVILGCVIGPQVGLALAWPAGMGLLGFIVTAFALRRSAPREEAEQSEGRERSSS